MDPLHHRCCDRRSEGRQCSRAHVHTGGRCGGGRPGALLPWLGTSMCLYVYVCVVCPSHQHVDYEGFTNDSEEGATEGDCMWMGPESDPPAFPSAQVLTSSGGTVLGRSTQQVFATTSTPLQMGMCGGPITDAHGR